MLHQPVEISKGVENKSEIHENELKGLMVEDKSFLKKILKVPVSTTNCLVYLETGQIPIENLIKAYQVVLRL